MALTDTHMTEETPELEDHLPDWGWKGLMALGVLMLVGGILAFFNPFAASLTVELVAGFGFLFVGSMQIWMAITSERQATGERWLTGALGVLLVLLAASLVINPLAGLVTLTIVVAVLFVLMGAMRIAMAWRARPRTGWGWMMASGALSVALGVLIVLGLPGVALGILGLFLALDLTFSGIATIAIAWQIRKREA